MSISRSSNTCTHAVIRQHLIAWSLDGYRFKDNLEQRDLKACKRTVDKVLDQIHPTLGLSLISKDGRTVIELNTNKHCPEVGPHRNLMFRYTVSNGTNPRHSPVNVSASGGRAHLVS
jgi:hypothetical protein